eukprot:TRINITY_DN10873_c0_g1_i1.p1 TRINITY_DN10873_c0_g1~~TRINITY_DN10873_c0_g1_i1.p1  ORF type:complete len:375 (-),score=101.91 TRINITY_DN10873_c0_g1_i1:25-1149(-)
MSQIFESIKSKWNNYFSSEEQVSDEDDTSQDIGISYSTVLDLIGNTPIIELKSLSEATGCTILAKCEFLNPGGSVKDRIAKSIIEQGETSGKLKPGYTVIEATAGSTGIALALVCGIKGYKLNLFIPDNVSEEKSSLLEAMGAKISVIPIVPLSDPDNFMHRAHKECIIHDDYFYADQFNNKANFDAHYYGTGPEIWKQTDHTVDGIVMAAGTGGTISGISTYLKEQNPNLRVALIDPPGSGLYNLVMNGTMYDEQDHMYVQPLEPRNVYEGIGINRQLEFISKSPIDVAYQGTDLEGVEMAQYLLENEGLFVGGSSALNCVGAVKLAREMEPGTTIVTVLCDGGHRYQSKLFNKNWLSEHDLLPTATDLSFIN